MRQGFIAAAVIAAGMFVIPSVQAASAGNPKIEVVDLQQVIAKCHRGQEANDSLQQDFAKLKANVDDKRNKAMALKDQLDKADAKTANYKTLTKQYQDAMGEYQQSANDSQQQIQKRQQALLQPIEQELQTVVNQYVKDNGIDILLTKGNAAVAVTDAYDATTGITEAMDKDWAALQKTQAPAAATKGH